MVVRHLAVSIYVMESMLCLFLDLSETALI